MTTLAYSHTLVAGTPENINDVQDMFNDVKTWANGNVDATNLAASADPATLMGAYRTVSEASLKLSSSDTGATSYIASGGGTAMAVASSNPLSVMIFPVTVADYAVSGLTTQFRVQVSTITNTVAPAVNFSFGAARVATVGGASSNTVIATLDAALGVVTRVAPAASTIFTDVSAADFTISTSGTYVMVVSASGTPAANSLTQFQVRLQVHNI